VYSHILSWFISITYRRIVVVGGVVVVVLPT